MEQGITLAIALGLCVSAPACKQTTTQLAEPYAHDYVYRKGDPCPYGRNTKIGESNNADGDSRRWRDRQNPENRGYDRGHGEFTTGTLHQRRYRASYIGGSGYPIHKGEDQR